MSNQLSKNGGQLVKSHAIDKIVYSLKNHITYQMESRYDLWGVFLDKEDDAVIFMCPSYSFLVENVGSIKEYVTTLKQNGDEGVNAGIGDRFVYYSWFYNSIEPYFIPDINPEKDIIDAIKIVDAVGGLEFDIASILNAIHRIDRGARVRSRVVIGEDIEPLHSDSAFIIFKNENGKKVFRLDSSPNIDFFISKDSTIPEEFIIPGEVYECSLNQNSPNLYFIDAIRRAGKGKLGINFREEDKYYDPKINDELNDFSRFFDDLLITTQSIKKGPEVENKRMPVVHVGTEELYDILISLYRMGFRTIEISLPKVFKNPIIISSEHREGLRATVVLGTKDYINYGYQRG